MTTYFDDYMSMYLGDLTLSMYKPMYLLLGNQKHTYLLTYLPTYLRIKLAQGVYNSLQTGRN